MKKKDPNKYMRPVDFNPFEALLAKLDSALQARLAKQDNEGKVAA